MPVECNEDDLKNVIPQVLPSVNDLAIPYEFAHIVEGGDILPNLTMDDLILVDSE